MSDDNSSRNLGTDDMNDDDTHTNVTHQENDNRLNADSEVHEVSRAMTRVQDVMSRELDKLRSKMERYLEEKLSYDKTKERIANCGKKQLKLNISGTRFETSCIEAENNPFFRTLMSNEYAQPDTEGFYFIDRDPTYFQFVLNFLLGGVDALDLDDLTPSQLRRIRDDADFYMISGLTSRIDEILQGKLGPSRFVTSIPINQSSATLKYFNGVFFVITASRPLTLRSISFLTGEKRVLSASLYFREGSVFSPSQSAPMAGEVEQQVERGGKVTISIIPFIELVAGKSYVIGVYSHSANAVAACPRAEGSRTYPGFSIDASAYTNDTKTAFGRKMTENEFDFVGELGLSPI